MTSRWREPFITVVCMAAATAFADCLTPTPGALVLAGVLALTMSRSRLAASWRGRGEALLILPLVALITVGVGMLLKAIPLAGAMAFSSAMFLSIWLRRFGPIFSRIGALLALPFITLLIVPGGGAGTTPWSAAWLSVAVLAIVTVTRLVAEALRFIPPMRAVPTGTAPALSSLRPMASTRMALQLAIAIAAAFFIGARLFPAHLTWVVLTAYLVCSGNRGRADVIHKSALRVLGAWAGTMVAVLALSAFPALHEAIKGATLAIALMAMIGVGLWLREQTYAAWSFVMTLVVTLLQGAVIPMVASSGQSQLWERVLAIVVGAVCGVASSWFVLPVRSEPIVRRRIADVLAELSAYLAERTPEAELRVEQRLDRLNEIAPPWHAWEPFCRRLGGSRNPGHWIRLVRETIDLARTRPGLSGAARRAVGDARRALGDSAATGQALAAMRDSLAA